MQRRDGVAVGALGVLLAGFFARSWLAWGDFDVDYGREMFVPWRLVLGDVLYRDVRYPYGPFSPYLHALGYGLWKPHLGVLYASGIVTTTSITVVLYAIARRLTTPGVAFLATALVILDLMCFPGAPGTFSYVFPYAYPALHGLLFLLLAVHGALGLVAGGGHRHAATAGTAIGLALLTKPEFGFAAIGVGVLASGVLLVREHRAAARLATLGALALGVAAFGYGVLASAVSPKTVLWRGLFAPEYFASGQRIFVLIAGFQPGATWRDMVVTVVQTWWSSAVQHAWLLAVVVGAGLVARRPARRFGDAVAATIGIGIALAAVACFVRLAVPGIPVRLAWNLLARTPRYGVLPVVLAATIVWDAVAFVREQRGGTRTESHRPGRFVVAVLGLALLMRVPAKLVPGGYANFYLPLGVIVLVHLLVDELPRALAWIGGSVQAGRAAAATTIVAFVVTLGFVRDVRWAVRNVRVETPRGTLVVPPDSTSTTYREVLAWLLDEAPPEASLVALPRGVSLAFLSGRGNHLYETSVVAVIPDAAAEFAYVVALARESPTLIVTSDQTQLEYGRGAWGIRDNVQIARWIRDHYVAVHLAGRPGMQLTIWRRRDDGRAASSGG